MVKSVLANYNTTLIKTESLSREFYESLQVKSLNIIVIFVLKDYKHNNYVNPELNNQANIS